LSFIINFYKTSLVNGIKRASGKVHESLNKMTTSLRSFVLGSFLCVHTRSLTWFLQVAHMLPLWLY